MISEYWKRYLVKEGIRSKFLNMERIKLVHTFIESQIVIPRLIEHKLLTAYFPLHNYYELHGYTYPTPIKKGKIENLNNKRLNIRKEKKRN